MQENAATPPPPARKQLLPENADNNKALSSSMAEGVSWANNNVPIVHSVPMEDDKDSEATITPRKNEIINFAPTVTTRIVTKITPSEQ